MHTPYKYMWITVKLIAILNTYKSFTNTLGIEGKVFINFNGSFL